jgi:hypothetical protein
VSILRHPHPWLPCVRFLAAIASAWLIVVQFPNPGGGLPVAAQPSKFSQSTSVFVSAWQRTFADHGKSFPVPRFVSFEGGPAAAR